MVFSQFYGDCSNRIVLKLHYPNMPLILAIFDLFNPNLTCPQ